MYNADHLHCLGPAVSQHLQRAVSYFDECAVCENSNRNKGLIILYCLSNREIVKSRLTNCWGKSLTNVKHSNTTFYLLRLLLYNFLHALLTWPYFFTSALNAVITLEMASEHPKVFNLIYNFYWRFILTLETKFIILF